MAIQRRVVLFIAEILDGHIARNNGDIDWLASFNRDCEDCGYASLMGTVDTIIMGRKTCEQLRGFDAEFPYKGRG